MQRVYFGYSCSCQKEQEEENTRGKEETLRKLCETVWSIRICSKLWPLSIKINFRIENKFYHFSGHKLLKYPLRWATFTELMSFIVICIPKMFYSRTEKISLALRVAHFHWVFFQHLESYFSLSKLIIFARKLNCGPSKSRADTYQARRKLRSILKVMFKGSAK